jgi:hypothetical protein
VVQVLLNIKDHAGRRRGFAVRLGSINRWLRYTGLRLFVGDEPDPDGDRPWTTIGVAWYGLPGSAGWRKIEGA